MLSRKNTNSKNVINTNSIKLFDKLNKLNVNTLLSTNFWFTVILIYLSFINIFIFKTTPDIIFLQFFIVVFIFLRVRSREFTKTWIPFIALFMLYEFLRGFADDLSPFGEVTLYWIYNLESNIFKNLPSKILQDAFSKNIFVINSSLFFYSIFFYYSFLIAFILWLKRKKDFIYYRKKFITLSYVGLIFFFLIPTAPPWMVNEVKNIGIERIIYGNTILKQFRVFAPYQYFVYGNPIAAFPSLHSAWPAFTSLFLIKTFKNKLSYLLLIIPLMIGFSVVLTGEHYVVDILAGYLLAGIILLI